MNDRHASASVLPGPESQHLSPVCDATLQAELADVIERWDQRAEGWVPELTYTQRAYAARRRDKLRAPYAHRLTNCARAGMETRCSCRGKVGVTWYTCRQHLLCRLCRKQRSKRYRAKIFKALERELASAPKGHQLVMLTLTQRPTGDLRADHAELMHTWRAYYKAHHRRFGRFSYVGVVELHKSAASHLHVVAVWPTGGPGDGTQGDWQLQRQLWLDSQPDSMRAAERLSFSASKTPGRAARYVSKYVAKGAQGDDFTPELRARVIAAHYNRRWVFTSAKMWESFAPVCVDCGDPIHRARFRFPHAPPRTVAERLRLDGWSVRGDPDDPDGTPRQTSIAFPDPDERSGLGCA